MAQTTSGVIWARLCHRSPPHAFNIYIESKYNGK